jgi:hypothetical protein
VYNVAKLTLQLATTVRYYTKKLYI